jgi:hypothetical protein
MRRKVLGRIKSGYALGFVLCLAGLILLVAVFLNAWPQMSGSQPGLSELWSYLWTAQLVFPFGIRLQLIYVGISGVVLFFGGIIVLLLSEKWFIFAGETVLLTCPYCKNHWRTSRAKGWVECPHCRQFIQPQVKKTR